MEQNDAEAWTVWWAEREPWLDSGRLEEMMRQREWWRRRPVACSYGDWLATLPDSERHELWERIGRQYMDDVLRKELEA